MSAFLQKERFFSQMIYAKLPRAVIHTDYQKWEIIIGLIGIIQVFSSHIDPQLSTLLIRWFIFQLKKVCPEAKSKCNSGNSVLQEPFSSSAGGLVPSKSHNTCSHIGKQWVPSASSCKNTGLQHHFHISDILHWKNDKNIHVCAHTYICLRPQRCQLESIGWIGRDIIPWNIWTVHSVIGVHLLDEACDHIKKSI